MAPPRVPHPGSFVAHLLPLQMTTWEDLIVNGGPLGTLVCSPIDRPNVHFIALTLMRSGAVSVVVPTVISRSRTNLSAASARDPNAPWRKLYIIGFLRKSSALWPRRDSKPCADVLPPAAVYVRAGEGRCSWRTPRAAGHAWCPGLEGRPKDHPRGRHHATRRGSLVENMLSAPLITRFRRYRIRPPRRRRCTIDDFRASPRWPWGHDAETQERGWDVTWATLLGEVVMRNEVVTLRQRDRREWARWDLKLATVFGSIGCALASVPATPRTPLVPFIVTGLFLILCWWVYFSDTSPHAASSAQGATCAVERGLAIFTWVTVFGCSLPDWIVLILTSERPFLQRAGVLLALAAALWVMPYAIGVTVDSVITRPDARRGDRQPASAQPECEVPAQIKRSLPPQ